MIDNKRFKNVSPIAVKGADLQEIAALNLVDAWEDRYGTIVRVWRVGAAVRGRPNGLHHLLLGVARLEGRRCLPRRAEHGNQMSPGMATRNARMRAPPWRDSRLSELI